MKELVRVIVSSARSIVAIMLSIRVLFYPFNRRFRDATEKPIEKLDNYSTYWDVKNAGRYFNYVLVEDLSFRVQVHDRLGESF